MNFRELDSHRSEHGPHENDLYHPSGHFQTITEALGAS